MQSPALNNAGVLAMSKFLVRRIFLPLILCSFISVCNAADEGVVSSGVKEKLLALSPQMPIDSVSASEVWLFQISKDGILYTDKNGDFLLLVKSLN